MVRVWRRERRGDAAGRLAGAVLRRERLARDRLLGGREPMDLRYAWTAAGAAEPAVPPMRSCAVLERYAGRRPARLLVTGAPGSGRTLLAVDLVLRLLEQRGPGDAVPVRLAATPADSEADAAGDADVAARLARSVRAAYRVPRAAAEELVREGRLVPVLAAGAVAGWSGATDPGAEGPTPAGRGQEGSAAEGSTPAGAAPEGSAPAGQVADGSAPAGREAEEGVTPGGSAAAGLAAFDAYLRAVGAPGAVLLHDAGDPEAARAVGAVPAWRDGADRVGVLPLRAVDARSYLRAHVAGPDRWRAVCDALTAAPDGPLAGALSNPARLLAAVRAFEARTASGGFARHPRELLDPALDGVEAICGLIAGCPVADSGPGAAAPAAATAGSRG
ncbi:hypothetical protein WDH52_14940 [Streptomyces sp. TRM70308]|uniref:hypothetical protein n=1 Tax=Streptomyces sp. TRM70308 TaxID=3131932 RepID=UPI003CFF6AED